MNHTERAGPLELGLQVAPFLAITLTDRIGGHKFIAPLTVVAAQSLGLALLAQTGYVPFPELLEAVRQEAERRAAADSEFLRAVGVAGGGGQ